MCTLVMGHSHSSQPKELCKWEESIDRCMGSLAACQTEKQRGKKPKNNGYIFISLCSTGQIVDFKWLTRCAMQTLPSLAPFFCTRPAPCARYASVGSLLLRPPSQGMLQGAPRPCDSWSFGKQLAEPLISSSPSLPVCPNSSTMPHSSISDSIYLH